MSLAAELDGVRWKLRRAIDQFTDLDVAIGELFANQSKAAGTKMGDEGDLIVTFPHEPPLDPRFALIIGDCIHNTRSALDHLVAQLAILHNAPDEAIGKTSFPVCLCDTDFKSKTVRKVAPYICSKALTKIEELQPYSTGDKEKDILWVLSQLDNIDKHRLLIVANHKVRVRSFSATLGDGKPLLIDIPPEAPWRSAENGAEILRFRLTPKPPTPMKMYVEMSTEGTIQIEQTGLNCDGANLSLVLRDSIEYVGGIINKFGQKFFGE
jgi:hypothetical protein